MKKVALSFIFLMSLAVIAATGPVDRIQRGSGANLGRVLVNADGSVTVTNPSGKATTFSGAVVLGNFTVAGLPANASGKLAYVTDGASASDCTVGGGSTKVLCHNNGTAWAAAGGASPGGADTQVQFNDGGAFGGDSGFTFNKTTNAITHTSNSATAFESGPNGGTNPVFKIVNSTASQKDGISVTGGTSGAGTTITALSDAANSNIILTPKGTGGVVIPDGTAATPALRVPSHMSGIYSSGTNDISITNGGTRFHAFQPSTYYLLSNTASIQLGASQDAIYSRGGAGIHRFGTTSANAAGIANFTKGRLEPLTVGTLGAGTAGDYAYVTDGDAALAWGATVVNTGAGATQYLVWFNGTNWTVVAK